MIPMTAPRKSLNLLLVDDESLVCDVVQSEVELLGHKIIGRAQDGNQAVRLAGELKPDAILMDIEMPELDGIEAARQIQALYPCPIVLLTAHDDADLVTKAGQAGAGAFLVKPPYAPEIDRTLSIAIARHSDIMELRRINNELRQAISEVKRLSGLLPICASCKRIKDDKGYWHEVEAYVQHHSEAQFSHGLCKECASKYFPDVNIPPDSFDR